MCQTTFSCQNARVHLSEYIQDTMGQSAVRTGPGPKKYAEKPPGSPDFTHGLSEHTDLTINLSLEPQPKRCLSRGCFAEV